MQEPPPAGTFVAAWHHRLIHALHADHGLGNVVTHFMPQQRTKPGAATYHPPPR